jgi:predicted house-cleaning noncanonical NTP pyrophosphatase (MazG superfamily)
MDKLKSMWDQQEAFMKLLQMHRGFTEFPVDPTTKFGQKLLKGITHECMHELFEANQMLKNSKDHRATEVKEFDRDGYVEELVDALHYFFEIAILSGVSMDELFDAYIQKGNININRIENGY